LIFEIIINHYKKPSILITTCKTGAMVVNRKERGIPDYYLLFNGLDTISHDTFTQGKPPIFLFPEWGDSRRQGSNIFFRFIEIDGYFNHSDA